MESVPEARQVVSRVLEEAGIMANKAGSGVRDDALLITSEMLANAVRACHTTLILLVEVHRTWLKLAVSDDSPVPAVRRQPGPDDTQGRGVDIIATLSTNWGQTPWDGTKKTVWSRLELPPEAAVSIACHEL